MELNIKISFHIKEKVQPGEALYIRAQGDCFETGILKETRFDISGHDYWFYTLNLNNFQKPISFNYEIIKGDWDNPSKFEKKENFLSSFITLNDDIDHKVELELGKLG